jgi:phage-related minor tail protein
MTGLSNEEMSVMQALADFRSSNAINDRQLLEDERQAVNYSIETRDLYLASIKERHKQEQDLIGQRLELNVYSPLLALEKQLIDQNYEARASLQALKEGRTELTEAEKAGLFIAKLQLAAKDLGLDKTLIDNILKEASALDVLIKKRKEDLALTELRNRITMAGALTPDARLRLQIDQDFPVSTPEKKQEIFDTTKAAQRAEELNEQMQGIASSIGDAFGNAFKGIITGTSSVREALAGMFRSIADSFADMVSQMISQWMRTQVLEGFQSIFSAFTGGLGGAVGGGGASFASAFGSSGPAFNSAAFSMPSLIPSANGNVLQGGFQAFANGGIVKGPTLGLVGEGRYNEAVVPLPDGRKIPVDLGGSSGGDIATSIVVNVSNGQASSETSGTQGNQLARELEGAVKQVILKETRPGGIIFSQR